MPAAADGSQNGGTDQPRKPRESATGWYWLLIVPFFGVFFPWIYNTNDPELIGIPFFYWYQMAWVPISVIITIFVYRATTERKPR
jgi:hypothetical protein